MELRLFLCHQWGRILLNLSPLPSLLVWVSQAMVTAFGKRLLSCAPQLNWQDALQLDSISCIPSHTFPGAAYLNNRGKHQHCFINRCCLETCWLLSWKWTSPHKLGLVFHSVSTVNWGVLERWRLLFLKQQLYSLNLGFELAAEPSSKEASLEDLVWCFAGRAAGPECGLETAELLCKEKLLLHTHCRVASHLVVTEARGTSFLQSHLGMVLSHTSCRSQCIQLCSLMPEMPLHQIWLVSLYLTSSIWVLVMYCKDKPYLPYSCHFSERQEKRLHQILARLKHITCWRCFWKSSAKKDPHLPCQIYSIFTCMAFSSLFITRF